MNTQWRTPIQLILVADDNAEATAIRNACAATGVNCQITHFSDGQTALAGLQGPLGRELQNKPYLILLDLDLPHASGLPFLDGLRADPVLRRTIVFTLSDSTQDEDKAAAYDRRVAGYLVKDAFVQDYSALCDLIDVYERSIQFPLG